MGRTPEPSLEEIHRSDSFIEELASGRPAALQDQGDAALAALLAGWRDETRWPPDTGLISESQAIAALNAGLAEKPSRGTRERRDVPPASRHRRGLSVVGAAAAAALCLGGFGAMVNGSQPGDSLYGLRTMMFGTPKQVRDEKVALAAKTELMKVQELIAQGDWQQAQEKLVAVSTQVASVGDEQKKQELLTQFNDLSAKVVERDPEATAPPGIVYTVAPSAAELVPAVAPPSDTAVPSAPATSAPATSAPATSAPATSGETTPATATTSETPTTAAPSSSTPSTTVSSSATTSAPVSTSATTPATTAASTAASTPTTAAAPASTVAPAQTSSPAPAAATSAAPSAAAATSAAPSAAAATSAATETVPTQTVPTQTVPTQTVPTQTVPTPVVTTTAVPLPAG